MKRFIAVCLLCAMSASVFTSCGKPNLEGRWELCNADGEALHVTVKFSDDGIVRIDGERSKYEVIDKDTVEIDGKESDFEIINKDESLIYIRELADETEKNALDSVASTLIKAANSAIVEMDEEDIYYTERAVICSDSSKDINNNPENAGADFDFAESVKSFVNDIDDYDYIIYIKDGYCQYTAVKKPSDDMVGIYPSGEFEDMTFDEVYEELKGLVE